MPERNLVSWNSMISCCNRNNLPELSIDLFPQIMHHRPMPNSVSITSLLVSVSSLAALQKVSVHKMTSQVVPCKTPPPPELPSDKKRDDLGRVSIWPSQFITILSNSVAAGEEIQLKPTTLNPVLSISPRNSARNHLKENKRSNLDYANE
ncbi:hypothetical protein C5167_033547 [Papaver somniferum]|uniref:Uncharacterized protein n=1 Tax=Papaver somniferum TaxID=3469 RepID=A0A4Y7KBX4_PAPSO|nr:hypothetical protein C5167_033547 [Papaver somniferum]